MKQPLPMPRPALGLALTRKFRAERWTTPRAAQAIQITERDIYRAAKAVPVSHLAYGRLVDFVKGGGRQ